jgi:hypothetical protein
MSDKAKAMQNAQEKLDELHKSLDRYEAELGLDNIVKPNEVDQYLAIPLSEFKVMAAEECGEVAYMLAQYALFIQKQYNRHYAIRNWATTNMNAMVVNVLDNYGNKWIKLEEKREKAIADNDSCMAFKKFIVESNKRLDILSFVAQKIEYISKAVLEYQNTKRRSK